MEQRTSELRTANELLERQRADLARDGGEAPVLIAITGWGAEEDKAKAFAAGFARHLTKPVDLDVLLSLMDEIARARKRGAP